MLYDRTDPKVAMTSTFLIDDQTPENQMFDEMQEEVFDEFEDER